MGRNQVVLDARIAGLDALRYTPAGLPVVSFQLNHQSEQSEAGGQRMVECELGALAFGELAQAIIAIGPGAAVSVKGFLARKSRHSTYPVLHVNQVKLIERGQ